MGFGLVNEYFFSDRFIKRMEIIEMKTYIIKCGDHDLYKIGKSERPYERLATLQTGSPWELEIVSVIDADVEKKLHKVFSQYSTRGEWFEIPEFKAHLVEKLIEEFDEAENTTEEVQKEYASGEVTSIRLPPSLKAQYKEKAKEYGVKYQQLMRDVLSNWLVREETGHCYVEGWDESGNKLTFELTHDGRLKKV